MDGKKCKKHISPARRAAGIVGSVLAGIIAVLALYVFISAFAAKVQKRPINVFGHSYYVVLTESMEPVIDAGDFVAVRLTEIDRVKKGDVIVFYNRNNYGELAPDAAIIHRVQSVETRTDGSIVLVTHGDANPDGVNETVTRDSFIGIMSGKSAFMGAVVTFASNPINWIFAIVLIAALYTAVRMGIKIFKIVRGRTEREQEKKLLLSVARELEIDTRGDTTESTEADGTPKGETESTDTDGTPIDTTDGADRSDASDSGLDPKG